jgi:hypothetical protein
MECLNFLINFGSALKLIIYSNVLWFDLRDEVQYHEKYGKLFLFSVDKRVVQNLQVTAKNVHPLC